MHPVRKFILEILKREGHATINDLAEKLEMAPVSVRHHLDLLIGDGLVVTPRVRRTPGAGRPQQVYALTPEADEYFPDNYRQLAGDALQALKEMLPKEQVQLVMADFARRTAAQMRDDVHDLPVQTRMQIVVDFLNEQGYMAGYETDEESIVLHTCNCPYNDLAPSHPELCQMDLLLVQQLTGNEVQRVAHIAEGDGRCSYRMSLQPERLTAIPLLQEPERRSVEVRSVVGV